jgi:hypothetical protein
VDDRIIELLYRNLQEVFGEGDAARRRATIEDFYTENCVLYVPPGVFVGHDALDKFAGDLRATHPHFVYTPHGEPQALHNGGILAWGSGPKSEVPDYTGLDVVIVRLARSRRSTSFSIPNLFSGPRHPCGLPSRLNEFVGGLITRPRRRDIVFKPRGITVGESPHRVRPGHRAMSAECPVYPKADIGQRSISTL